MICNIRRFLWCMFSQNRISGRMKRCDHAFFNTKSFLDLVFQFFHRFISKRNNQNLFRINLLFLHQIFHFCCNRCCLTRTGSCDHHAIIFIRQNHFSLIFIQRDFRIDCICNMIQILLFADHCLRNILLIMLFHKLFDIIILTHDFSNFIFSYTILHAKSTQHFALFQRPENMDYRIIRFQLFCIITFCYVNILHKYAFQNFFQFQQLKTVLIFFF